MRIKNTKAKHECPICSSKKSEKVEVMLEYYLSKCKECGFVWDQTPPKNLLSQYKKGYFNNDNPKGGYSNYFKGMYINKITFRERVKKIEGKLGKKGKMLDVGCALGDCLLEAKKLGWKNTHGVEVSDYAYKYAKKRGLKVKKGTLREAKFKNNSFDVLLYQDVIEHITDPVEELTLANKTLKSGGMAYLITPDIGGVWSKLLGEKWYHYKPGEHVSYFDKPSIKEALEQAGFENIETRIAYHVLSLEYILDRLRYYSPSIFGSLHKIVLQTPFKSIPFRAYIGELEAIGYKPE